MVIDQTMESDSYPAPGQPGAEATDPCADMWCVARRRLGWSLDFAAREIGISELHLEMLETGIRTADDALMGRLATAYGIEADRILARARAERMPPRYDADTGTVWLGWLPVVTSGFDNEQLLVALSTTLRTMRSLEDYHPIYLRDSDLLVLAPLFDLDDNQLSRRMMTCLGLTPAEAVDLLDRVQVAVDSANQS